MISKAVVSYLLQINIDSHIDISVSYHIHYTIYIHYTLYINTLYIIIHYNIYIIHYAIYIAVTHVSKAVSL